MIRFYFKNPIKTHNKNLDSSNTVLTQTSHLIKPPNLLILKQETPEKTHQSSNLSSPIEQLMKHLKLTLFKSCQQARDQNQRQKYRSNTNWILKDLLKNTCSLIKKRKSSTSIKQGNTYLKITPLMILENRAELLKPSRSKRHDLHKHQFKLNNTNHITGHKVNQLKKNECKFTLTQKSNHKPPAEADLAMLLHLESKNFSQFLVLETLLFTQQADPQN